MLDLNDVAIFVEVVRFGSFVGAARQLGVPPNTVSRRVHGLEVLLGTRLMHRSTRKLSLTDAGLAFHERCAGSVEALMQAGDSLISGGQEANGLVRIAAPAAFFDYFPMAWIADFLHSHRRVRLDFVLSDTSADLIAERIDIALRAGPLIDTGYVGRQLIAASSSGMLASPTYISERGMPTDLSELADHDCLHSPQPGMRGVWRLAGPGGVEEEVEITGRFSGNTAQSLRKAALAGLGIALLPPAATGADVHAGLLVPVLPQYRRTGLGLNVLYPSRRHVPVAVALFIELLSSKLGELESLAAT